MIDALYSMGEWIRRRRKALDMTQKALADRVGCALITMARIEADERRPSRDIALLLAEHLQVPPEQRAAFVRVARGEINASRLVVPVSPDLAGGWQSRSPQAATQNRAARATPATIPTEGAPATGWLASRRLVGRRSEMTVARTAWQAARRGESQVLVISGEPGAGKSRLAAELAAEVCGQDWRGQRRDGRDGHQGCSRGNWGCGWNRRWRCRRCGWLVGRNSRWR